MQNFLVLMKFYFIYQGNKTKVPIGLNAENKQASLVMYVEFKVELPDDDFVIAN